MSRCKWWEKEEGRGGQRLREGRGGSLYTPKHNCQMMQVEARELNEELRRRRATRHPVTGTPNHYLPSKYGSNSNGA